MPDVCDYTVSRIASVDVCSAVNLLRLLSFVDHLFFFFFSNGCADDEYVDMRIHFGLVREESFIIRWGGGGYIFMWKAKILTTPPIPLEKHT